MNAAVIVAAGRGTRMGLERNKVLAPLCGEPVIARTVRAFERTGWFDGGIVVVTGACDLCEMKRILADAGLHAQVVLGGADRQESVCRGLAATNPEAKYVAIHDGARPLILPEQVDEMVRLGRQTYAAAPALPVTDTVKVADTAGLVQSTPDRRTLFAVQTPQVFQANILKAALQSAIEAGAELTDDCSAVERLGKEVYLAPGWRENIKITTASDLTLAEALLRERENRA